MVKQSATKKKSTTTKSKTAKKPSTKAKASKTSSKQKQPSEPFRPMLMTVAVSSLAAVTLFGFAMISIL